MVLNNITSLLKKYNKKVWVMNNSDSSDEIFDKYFFKGLSSKTLCIVSQSKVYLIVSTLDKDNLKRLEIEFSDKTKNMLKSYVYSTNEEFVNILEDIIAKLHFPSDISLSYSTMSDNTIDILSHGAYVSLTKLFKKVYKKYSKKVKFSSAENIIYDLISKKSKVQIERLKELACITDNILKETFSKITVGLTEIDIANLTLETMEEIMKNITSTRNDIVYYDVAWKDCPIVLTGENLAKGGHTLPSEKRLNYGDTIYFDFGIKVEFCDGEVLYTDMQRMGYAMPSNTSKIPKSVKKVFGTLLSSIDFGLEEMKPDVKAYTIDNIVRKKILKSGFPDYNHATGHSVGLNVHDAGAVISLKKCKRANLNLVEDGVYTLEPRINISNGGSIEEMIQVTKFGGIPLCEPQKELYIVN